MGRRFLHDADGLVLARVFAQKPRVVLQKSDAAQGDRLVVFIDGSPQRADWTPLILVACDLNRSLPALGNRDDRSRQIDSRKAVVRTLGPPVHHRKIRGLDGGLQRQRGERGNLPLRVRPVPLELFEHCLRAFRSPLAIQGECNVQSPVVRTDRRYGDRSPVGSTLRVADGRGVVGDRLHR